MRKNAKLVQIIPISLYGLWMFMAEYIYIYVYIYIYIATMVCKPTYKWGAPPSVCK